MRVSNQTLDAAFAFIRDTPFDLFCLQEVPASFLTRLQTLPFHLAHATDVEDFRGGRWQPCHLVILSRTPLSGGGVVTFPDYWPTLPLRTRLFVRLMHPFGWSQIRNRSGHFADTASGGARLRIFNLHLTLAHPDVRIREFEQALAERDPALPALVCGDLNILESPRVSLVNWLSGGPFADAIRFWRERARFEERFAAHGLRNPLRGTHTHPLAKSQLDHILASHHFTIRTAERLDTRYGSDHYPVRAEIA